MKKSELITRADFEKLNDIAQSAYLARISPANLRLSYNTYKGLHAVSTAFHRKGTIVHEEAPLSFLLRDEHLNRFCCLCGIEVARATGLVVSHVLRDFSGKQRSICICDPCGQREEMKDVPRWCRLWAADLIGDMAAAVWNIQALMALKAWTARRVDFARAMLLSHRKHIRDTDEVLYKLYVARSASIMLGSWDESRGLSANGAMGFLDIASFNQHAVADGGMTEQIGAAFFPAISMLNHRCVPNLQYKTVRRDGRLFGQLVALVDIPPGEELTTDYVNNGHEIDTILRLGEDRQARKVPLDIHYQIVLKLAAKHRFRCRCDECMNCVRCGRGADTQCPRCGFAWCSTACKHRDPLHVGTCELMARFRANH